MTDSKSKAVSLQKKFFCWMNIFLKIFLPVTISLTPAVAANTGMLLPLPKSMHKQRAQIYTLAQSEPTDLVAARFNITAQELRELNRFRTFSDGYEGLRASDELEVPIAPLAAFSWDKEIDSTSLTSSGYEQKQPV